MNNFDKYVSRREDNGLHWITQDQVTYGIIVNDYIGTIKPALNLLREKKILGSRAIIQAGGHCGLYPLMFTEYFKMIFTFEPNALNFHCLVNNCQGENLIKMNVALGKEPGRVKSVVLNPINTGMNRVVDAGDAEYYIPIIPLDSLGLTGIDMIELDLEEVEYDALLGARQTIEKNKPVLMIENATDQIKEYLSELGYSEWKKINRLDSIFVLNEDMEKLNDS
jgi:FkbM family methyltransferase